MSVENPGCICIVDYPAGAILFLENVLQPHLAPTPTIAFDSREQFLRTVESPQIKRRYNWFVVIADVVALYPTVEEGIFYQIYNKRFFNWQAVGFTADPLNPGWDKLLKNGLMVKEHIVARADPEAVPHLVRVLMRIVNGFGCSADLNIRTTDLHQCGVPAAPEAKIDMETAPTEPIDDIGYPQEPTAEAYPEDEEKRQSDSRVPMKLDVLVQPDSYLYKLLTKDILNWFERVLLREVTWTLFTKLSRSHPEHLEAYRRLVRSDTCPIKKPALRIVRQQLGYSQEKPSK